MNRQYLRGAAIGTLFLAIVAGFPVKVPTADQSGVPLPGVPTVAPATTAANTPAIHPIGGLYSGITAQQQFPANGARVRSIRVQRHTRWRFPAAIAMPNLSGVSVGPGIHSSDARMHPPTRTHQPTRSSSVREYTIGFGTAHIRMEPSFARLIVR